MLCLGCDRNPATEGHYCEFCRGALNDWLYRTENNGMPAPTALVGRYGVEKIEDAFVLSDVLEERKIQAFATYGAAIDIAWRLDGYLRAAGRVATA